MAPYKKLSECMAELLHQLHPALTYGTQVAMTQQEQTKAVIDFRCYLINSKKITSFVHSPTLGLVTLSHRRPSWDYAQCKH